VKSEWQDSDNAVVALLMQCRHVFRGLTDFHSRKDSRYPNRPRNVPSARRRDVNESSSDAGHSSCGAIQARRGRAHVAGQSAKPSRVRVWAWHWSRAARAWDSRSGTALPSDFAYWRDFAVPYCPNNQMMPFDVAMPPTLCSWLGASSVGSDRSFRRDLIKLPTLSAREVRCHLRNPPKM